MTHAKDARDLRPHPLIRRLPLLAGALYVTFWAVTTLVALSMDLPERLSAESSTVVEFHDGTVAHVFLSPDDKWRVPVNVADVDPRYVDALLRLEDKRFRRHFGVDPVAIARAAFLNVTRMRRVSGGSTLTLQLVRVLEPRPRTMASKVVESFRAYQLELRLSKEQILAAYLQFVPYGRNVEGLESAALAYFGHTARNLSPQEIATLLAVPQNPTRRHPSAANRERLRFARNEIAARLLAQGALPLRRGSGPAATPEAVLAEVQAASVPELLQKFPRVAPHAAIWFRQLNPKERRIRTTLDEGLQRTTEKLVAAEADEAHAHGIQNTSVVLVDHRSHEVVALVGNFDFWDGERAGQVIGFSNPRSPGSALKPFIYALGIDRGLSNPVHLVPDVPRSYGTYAPKNFDNTFSGLVTLEDSLSRSLNLPFIELLSALGVEPFLGSLRAMGARSLATDPGHYGLSAAVGGIELSPLEVASLYATLANDGVYHPVRHLLSGEKEARGNVVFSPGAAYLTRRALSLKDRPDFPSRRDLSRTPPSIHWKTGTSFGHRDAWAAGSGPRYTAVVWMGNFDNTPSKRLIGSEASGPLLFNVLEAVSSRSESDLGDAVPRDLVGVEVCSYSGKRPTEACKHRKGTLARRSNVPTEPCPYHVELDVEVTTGLALTPACRGGKDYERRVFVQWPATIRRWLRDQQRQLPEPPSFAADCERGGTPRPPTILSPAQGQVAVLIPGVPADRQELPLEAETAQAEGQLSWFVDGELVGSADSDERLWWIPKVGVHEVVVQDESGFTAKRKFEVRDRRN